MKLRDDKGSFRLDATSRWGMLSGYYFFDDYVLNNPYPTGQGGATVPGFSATNRGRAQLVRLLNTKTVGATAVNEVQFSYTRNAAQLGNPVGGVGITLASQGFVTGPGTPGIVPLAPEIEGVANIAFNSFTIGETTAGLSQTANTFEWLENFSKQIHTHSIALGVEVMFNQVNADPNVQKNGSFGIAGTETGVDFADFLLGIASEYTQGESRSFYNRNRYLGMFIQDSWRATRRLTLNYGLRYDPLMPWYEKHNQIQTLVLGEQSVVFPGAPAGLVVPGDPGIPRTLAPTRWNNFSPRIGLAYSPPVCRGRLGSILGGEGRSSIHAGFGRFFASIGGISAGVMSANAPFGITYTSPAPPLMETPFISAADGSNQGQRFPISLPPLDSSAKNPDPNVNWSLYVPVTGVPGYLPTNRSPYTEQYNLSIQRQIKASNVLKIAYVGSQAHHLLLLVEANPGDAALCLSVSQPSQVMPGTATCGPFGESATYVTANGAVIKSTRGPYGSNFGSDTYQAAAGNSNFNSLQVTFRHSGHGMDFLGGYTYGKSLDFASSLGDQVNPYNYRLLYSPSSFDLKQNFLFSYVCEIPIAYIFESKNRLTEGWIFSGITRFTTGFPVTLDNSSDHSLLGTQPNGVNNYGVDEPNFEPGPLEINQNPRNGKPYFNTSLFSLPPLGQYGNAKRRMFYGPGSANFDMAVLKRVTLKESSQLEFRFDFFNAFNHAQFFGPETVDDEILSPGFGQVISSAPPRLVQVAMKILF